MGWDYLIPWWDRTGEETIVGRHESEWKSVWRSAEQSLGSIVGKSGPFVFLRRR